jgi:type I restriction enzyme, S subunit
LNNYPFVRLDSVARVVRGVTYAKGDVVLSPGPGDIPVLRAGNINGRLITDHDLVWLRRRAVSDDQLLRDGDVVMCMSSGSATVVGKSAQLKTEWVGSFGAFCAAVRAEKSRADAGYIAHVLETPAFRAFAGAALGNNIKNLNKSALEGYRLPFPPLDEQQRIVALLDRAAEIRRRADAARAKARAIIPALFLDTFGDPATNPKGWPVVTVGDLPGVELRNGISPSKMGKVIGNVLTLSAITRGSFDQEARKQSTFATSLAEDQMVSRSLFMICRGNGNRHLVGQGAFPTSDMPGVAFPDTMIALRILESEVAPAYLTAVWSSAHLRAQINAAAKTTNGTFKINQK